MKLSLVKVLIFKVNVKLIKQFEDSDYVIYFVKMKEQVDMLVVLKQVMEKVMIEKQMVLVIKLFV